MYDPSGHKPREPILNLPPAVTVLLVLNTAIFAVLWAVPEEWRGAAIAYAGFIPAWFSSADLFEPLALLGPITHQFLHGSWAHLGLNMVMLAAFGSGVEKAAGAGRAVLLYLLAGLGGAALHFALYPDSTAPVVGASGAISGLFGAVLHVVAAANRRARGGEASAGGGFRRLWPVIAIWIGLSVVTGFTDMINPGGARVAWAAHIGGFLVGLALFPVIRPPRPPGTPPGPADPGDGPPPLRRVH